MRTKIPNSQEIQLHDISVLAGPDVEGLALPEVGAATYDTCGERLVVRCAGDTFVAIARVKQEGKALLDARDWWNGIRGSAWWDGGRYVRLGRVAQN